MPLPVDVAYIAAGSWRLHLWIKPKFSCVEVRFRGLAKNTAQLVNCLPCRACGWLADPTQGALRKL